MSQAAVAGDKLEGLVYGNSMQNECLVVADRQSWLTWWEGSLLPFEEIAVEKLASYGTVILAPDNAQYQAHCLQVIDWKRSGQLPDTRLILGTYKGRHIWSPENDAQVEHWVVHARSERLVLASERLAFVPLCVMPPRKAFEPGDDGYLFMGGRKWRELGVGLEAMSRSGLAALEVDKSSRQMFVSSTCRA